MGHLSSFFILPSAFRRQVNLRFALIDQGNVGLNEEVEPREDTALAEPGLGFHGAGDGDPYVALLLGERAPTGGDGAEMPTDSDLRGGARVERDEGWIANLAVTGALPD